MIKRLTLLALFWLAFAAPAVSHSWYDSDCCSGEDCAPALTLPNGEDDVTAVPGGRIIKSEYGTVFVPDVWMKNNKDKHRPSRDRHVHVCAIDAFSCDDEYGMSEKCGTPEKDKPPKSDPKRWTVRCVYDPVQQ